MNMKKVLLASALLIGSASSQAASVLGINWDPNAPTDFTSHGFLWESIPLATTDNVVTGYGVFSAFNGASYNGAGAYGGGTYGLTFVFTTTLDAFAPNFLDPDKTDFRYKNGHVDVYSTLLTTYNPNNSTPAGLATQTLANATGTAANLFLSLDFDGFLTGSAINFGTAAAQGSGSGYLDVVGGAAAAYFDTDKYNALSGGRIADLNFSSSFGQAADAFPPGYPLDGTIDVFGNTKPIPEPATLALLGLGILGASVSSRRKQA